MPSPTTPKEVKQFLGLIGYYRKFIPKFSDVARPLTNLTKKDIPFEWTPECQMTFQLLKALLMAEPILKYPDPNKSYILYTGASKYAWSCVLTQEYEYEIEGKIKKHTSSNNIYLVDCLRVVKLIGLPSLKRHMLFTGL